MSLDLNTLLFAVAFSILLQFVALFYQLRAVKHEAGIYWWFTATGLLAVGVLIGFVTGNFLKASATVLVSNTLIVLGEFCYFIAIKKYLRRKIRFSAMTSGILLLLILSMVFTLSIEQVALRRFSTSIAIFIISVLTAQSLYRFRTKAISISANFLMGVFSFNALFWLSRAIFYTYGLQRGAKWIDLYTNISYLSLLFLSTLGTLGYIVMINQQLMANITEEKSNFKAIALSSASWEAWFDADTKLIWTNENVEKMTGLTVQECFEKESFIEELVANEDLAYAKQYVSEALNGVSGEGKEIRIKHKNGTNKWVLVSWRPIKEVVGDLTGFRTSVVDITEKKEAEFTIDELVSQLQIEKNVAQKNAITDGLTGLYNRRYFDERMVIEYFRMKRNNTKLSIVLMDVDFFKLYNDTYGHLQGDECLKQVAETLKNSIKRAADFVARYGGEEFVAILPETDEIGARKIAENIRQTVETLGIRHDASKISNVVTISLGVATISGNCNLPPELVAQLADEALYEAKNSGRNRVEYAKKNQEESEADAHFKFVHLVWSAHFESGNVAIDSQHKKLFEDSNALLSMLTEPSSQELCYQYLNRVIKDLKIHFESEEEILQLKAYPDLKYHAKCHTDLLEKAIHLKTLFENKEIRLEEVLTFVIHDVVAEHLFKEDKKFFSFIQN